MLGIAGYSTVHAAGVENAASWRAVLAGASGLKPNDLPWCELPCWIGAVAGVDDVELPAELRAWDCRTHRLAWMALRHEDLRAAVAGAVARYGAARVGVVLGSSTSGIRSTELAYVRRREEDHWPQDFDYRRSHSLDALCRFSAEALGLQGPMVAVSTACSSSAKVFLTARRWMACGLIDAALVGGVDSLCLSTLHGFDSLQLLAGEICRPFDAERHGISIGEAAGFAVLDKQAGRINFAGGGESSDAWHMSTPRPDGAGAQQAMQAALQAAALTAGDIGYVNAHGTGTLANDRAEAIATAAVFGPGGVPVSSTKGVTGHTLGAAGITEAIATIQALEAQTLPPSANLRTAEPGMALDLVTEPRHVALCHAMSNSFGFGGSNCSLIFSRAD
ncbi:MAG: beta-ketoacyl-ACP synthase [Proteobacteria bacterium]|nr:beta-ketoacyl-ACP synthase [Pseudomonadota bacterium]